MKLLDTRKPDKVGLKLLSCRVYILENLTDFTKNLGVLWDFGEKWPKLNEVAELAQNLGQIWTRHV